MEVHDIIVVNMQVHFDRPAGGWYNLDVGEITLSVSLVFYPPLVAASGGLSVLETNGALLQSVH